MSLSDAGVAVCVVVFDAGWSARYTLAALSVGGCGDGGSSGSRVVAWAVGTRVDGIDWPVLNWPATASSTGIAMQAGVSAGSAQFEILDYSE